MSDDGRAERHPGQGVWGTVLPVLFVGLWFVLLRWTGGRGPSLAALVPATIFFGLVTLDLAAASWKAIDRQRGRSTGNHSNMVVLSALLLMLWLGCGTTAFSGHGWPTEPGIILVSGVVAMVVEAVGVQRLGRVAKRPPAPPGRSTVRAPG